MKSMPQIIVTLLQTGGTQKKFQLFAQFKNTQQLFNLLISSFHGFKY